MTNATIPTNVDRPVSLTPTRRETADLLRRLYGDVFADRYIDYVRLATNEIDLRVSLPIAAHAMREIESTLRGVLRLPITAPLKPDDDARLVAARNALVAIGFDDDRVNKACEALLASTHKEQIRAIIEWLDLDPKGEVAKAWLSWVGAQHKYAHRRSFSHDLKADSRFRAEFLEPLDLVLRETSLALQSKFGGLIGCVDSLVQLQDRGSAVRRFKNEIPGAEVLQRRFFNQLHTPDWIEPLRREGLLDPPAVNQDDIEAGIVRWREWPAGSFIVRMATTPETTVQRQIVGVLRGLANAEEYGVIEKGYEAGRALPAAMAAELTDVFSGWIARPHFWTLRGPEMLLEHLMNGGANGAALAVAGALFSVSEVNGRLSTRYDRSDYEYALVRLGQGLSERLGFPFFEMLVHNLRRAALLSDYYKPGTAGDYTSISARHIDDDSFRLGGVYYGLIGATRDAAAHLVGLDPMQMERVVDLLHSEKLDIFRALALRTLSRAPDAAPDLATAFLFDDELMSASWCATSYGELAKQWFPRMSPDNQSALLAAIDRCSTRNEDAWRLRFRDSNDRDPTAAEVGHFRENVLLSIVWTWRDCLPSNWQTRIAEIETRHGPPFSVRVASGAYYPRDPSSPLSIEELRDQPIAELARFLEKWRPPKDVRNHSPGALAFALRRSAEEDPTRYSEAAGEFVRVPHVYIRALLEGIAAATRNGRGPCWGPLLKLCDELVAKPVDPNDFVDTADADYSLNADIFTSLFDCICAGLLRRPQTRVPLELLPIVRRILARAIELSASSIPEAAAISIDGGDYYFEAQWTPFGRAVEASILAAWWRIDVGHEELPLPRAPRKLDEFEVGLLDRALRSSGRRKLRALGVMGRYLGLLHFLDEKWLVENFDRLLPSDDRDARTATWGCHILHDRVVFDLWPQTAPHYAESIEGGRPPDVRDDRFEEALALHVSTLYLNGLVDLSSHSLMSRLLRGAEKPLRQRIMWLVSHWLTASDADSDGMREQAQSYVDARLADISDSDPRRDLREEFSSLSQHFQSAKDQDWMSNVAMRLAKLRIAPTYATNLIEWLATWADDRALDVLQCLTDLVMDPEQPKWMIREHREGFRTIIEKALVSADPRVGEAAKSVVNTLLSMGEDSFVDLRG